MNPAEPTEDFVPSPCVRICTLDEHGVCQGCLRSVAEITAWGAADAPARRRILARVEARRQQRQGR
jgi:uncharacterized protein